MSLVLVLGSKGVEGLTDQRSLRLFGGQLAT